MSGEELGKKLDKLLKQSEEQLQKLNGSSKELRAHIFGQDRYWRRYWELPCAGGIYVEAMESAEPEVLSIQAELDEKYKDMPVEEKTVTKPEVKQEEDKTGTENRENETPNELKEEKKVNAHNEDVEMKEVEQKEKEKEKKKKKSEDGEEEVTSIDKKEVNHCNSEDSKNSIPEVKKEVDSEAKNNSKEEKAKEDADVTNMEVDIKTEETKKEENGTDEEIIKPAIKIEDKIVETIANGDKFNHVNNLHNGKELNGSYLSGKTLILRYSNTIAALA